MTKGMKVEEAFKLATTRAWVDGKVAYYMHDGLIDTVACKSGADARRQVRRDLAREASRLLGLGPNAESILIHRAVESGMHAARIVALAILMDMKEEEDHAAM